MGWPTGDQYSAELQHPGLCFADPVLKAGSCDINGLQQPVLLSGSFAMVASLRSGGTRHAVRLFKVAPPDQRERYGAITRYLKAHSNPAFVAFDFQETGVKIAGNHYPILKMEWAGGKPLNQAVAELCKAGDRQTISLLADHWLDLMRQLDAMDIAHGDLQHGNVLVDGTTFRLVDYDGMYVPEMKGKKAVELGVPAYQHPNRTEDHFSQDLDRFAGLVIYIALLALSESPALWSDHDDGDNVLFTRNDLRSPGSSSLVRKLRALGAPGLQAHLDKLVDWCGKPHYPTVAWLDDPRQKHLDSFAGLFRKGLYGEAVSAWTSAGLDGYPPAQAHRSEYDRALTLSDPRSADLKLFIAQAVAGEAALAVHTWQTTGLETFAPAGQYRNHYVAALAAADPMPKRLKLFESAYSQGRYSDAVREWEVGQLAGYPPAAKHQPSYEHAKRSSGPQAAALHQFLSLRNSGDHAAAVDCWRQGDLDGFPDAATYQNARDDSVRRSDTRAQALAQFEAAYAAGEYRKAHELWANGGLDGYGPARPHDSQMDRAREHVSPQAEALARFILAVTQSNASVAIVEWEQAGLDSFGPAQSYRARYLTLKGGTATGG